MTEHKNNNDKLKDFLIDEDEKDVQKRIDLNDNDNSSQNVQNPWVEEIKEEEENHKNSTNNNLKNKNSSYKNFFILIIIIVIGFGIYIYNSNNNISNTNKISNLNNSSEFNYDLEILFRDIDYELTYSWNNNIYLANLINITNNKVIKEVEFHYKSGVCEETKNNEDNWYYEKFNIFLGPNKSKIIKIKNAKDKVSVYDDWCIGELVGSN